MSSNAVCATRNDLLLQFEWENYGADLEGLAAMTREEVVAMLKRNSTGFSRRALPLCQP